MFQHESEFSLGVGGESPEKFSIPETPFQEIIPEESSSQPEIPISQQEIPHIPKAPSQPETPIIKEKQEEQPVSHEQEPIKTLLVEKLREKWEKREITSKEKRKVDITLKKLWPVYAVVCTIGALAIGPKTLFYSSYLLRTRSITSLLWKIQSDPLFIASYLMVSVSKLITMLAFENRYGIGLSPGLKASSFWNLSGGGLAIPFEIAYTLGEGSWLLNEIIKRYLASPWRDLNKAFEDISSVFTKQ